MLVEQINSAVDRLGATPLYSIEHLNIPRLCSELTLHLSFEAYPVEFKLLTQLQ